MPRLGPQQWIDEGLRLLIRSGIEAVRVEALAKTLKVTKGSFYWHFADRAALLTGMLETWQARATDAIIAQVEAKGGEARDRLATLFTITVRADGRLERAIRGWAIQDEAAAHALSGVDARRVAYLVQLFTDLGYAPDQALARAKLGYLALIGQHMSKDRLGPDGWLASSLEAIIAIMTAPAAKQEGPTT